MVTAPPARRAADPDGVAHSTSSGRTIASRSTTRANGSVRC